MTKVSICTSMTIIVSNINYIKYSSKPRTSNRTENIHIIKVEFYVLLLRFSSGCSNNNSSTNPLVGSGAWQPHSSSISSSTPGAHTQRLRTSPPSSFTEGLFKHQTPGNQLSGGFKGNHNITMESGCRSSGTQDSGYK